MIGQVLYSDADYALMTERARPESAEFASQYDAPAPQYDAGPSHSQEDIAGMQAWAALTTTLGLSTSATQEEVAAALIERGVAPAEAADWLPACNFDTTCFVETMHYELREGEKRKRAVGMLALAGVVGLGVIAVGAYLVIKRRS